MSGVYLLIETARPEDRDGVIEKLQELGGSGVGYVGQETFAHWNITAEMRGSADQTDFIYRQALGMSGVSLARVVDTKKLGIGGVRVYQHPGNGKPCDYCKSIHQHTVKVDKDSGETACVMRESDIVPSNPITNLLGIAKSAIKL